MDLQSLSWIKVSSRREQVAMDKLQLSLEVDALNVSEHLFWAMGCLTRCYLTNCLMGL